MRQWVNQITFFALVILFLGVSACASTKPPTSPPSPPALDNISAGPPKNVIFLIGDGMGLPQITGAMYMNNNSTVFERFKNIGFHKSHASDNLVTDSAAGATAFASGVKTYNGAIGVDAKKNAVPTLLEMAEKKGMATGMVATSSITHATPAAFIAHVTGREQQDAIALGFLDTDIDLFIGGGLDDFARRVDQRNLVEELEAKGYDIKSFFDTPIESINTNSKKNIGYFTANGEPLPATQGRDYFFCGHSEKS